MDLTLEIREQANETTVVGPMMLTPLVHDDYWSYRVKLSESQSVIGFPKFTTFGIGFAAEEDWNSNLNFVRPAEQIWQHIRHNKGDDAIADDDCREAIRMIQQQIHADHPEIAAQFRRPQ